MKAIKIKKRLLPICIYFIKLKKRRINKNIDTNFRENNKNINERKELIDLMLIKTKKRKEKKGN